MYKVGALMKKIMLISLTLGLLFMLSGCFILREKIKATPDEMSIPEGSEVAICTKDNVEYKYIFQEDGVYLFFIEDVEQDEAAIDHELEQAYLHDQSVLNYLYDEYGSTNCIISDYEENDE